MKKLLKATLLSTVLSATLMADVVFDLGAQQFYYCVTDKTNDDGTISDQYVEASYDVDTASPQQGSSPKIGTIDQQVTVVDILVYR